VRSSEMLERGVGGCRISSGLGSYLGTEGAGLSLLAGLALCGRLLGTHMSQWHHPRSGWGRRRDFSGRSTAKKGGNHIPERWKDYLPVGQRMPGTRFIAFKVPLQKSFEKKLAPEELPDDETIFKFKHAVNGFLKENKDNDKLIGVHRTHGLNRTGYLICRYLIDVEGVRPDDAFILSSVFNRCRGHCLERQNCIEDLQNGPIRNVPRSSGFEDSAHLMQPVHNKPVKQGPRYNLHQIQGHSTQNLQQSVRKFSENPHVYQRCHLPPPGPPGEDCSHRRYSWNVKPNASRAAEDRRRWYPYNYSRLSYPACWEWTQ
uniref:Tyrosine specific protein phosphatases domain-containing protein n=1 Tax=Nomascus leucogenys TaxID=61853 RepID=M3ZBQ6_NOMLE